MKTQQWGEKGSDKNNGSIGETEAVKERINKNNEWIIDP